MIELPNESIDISVAIPTYNGAKNLPILLEKLIQQIGLKNIKGEIIIVDNNSKDNTAEIISNYQANWNHNFPLRYCLEKEQGAAFARLRAVKEAKGELIAFLDDDNLPASDWVIQAYKFAEKYPQAGVWSGQIHGDYEVEPPANFKQIQAFMAIREHGDKPFLFDANNLRLPPGAAFTVRKKAWDENVPSRPTLSGKLPGIMVQGDDYEPFLYINEAGWEIWYNPEMHTYHQIPSWRLEKDYLISLARGCGLPICQLRLITAKKWQKPLIFYRTFLGNLRRVLHHLIKYRGELKTDLIALFEMEFYLSSMISPFYALKCYIRRSFGKTTNVL
ncbi:MAG: hormogonium polysaccharide biosynthesis glycosyltransferase HpsE [Scytonematopsis contorta HA4267-MV1]|jgi:glycosyltransferase involved in cell wall biosynthesis|nr:hormogonium polysaccharide biosynthesis glycosyltransferase HpsE [Scytonematopsis contorta HA4267-MV1]